MCRKRQWRDCRGVRESKSARGQGVYRRRLRCRVPVASDVVSPKRVDGNKEDVKGSWVPKDPHRVREPNEKGGGRKGRNEPLSHEVILADVFSLLRYETVDTIRVTHADHQISRSAP